MVTLDIPFEDRSSLDHDVTLHMFPMEGIDEILPELTRAILSLWADGGFQKCYRRRAEYHLDDNFEYCVESWHRLGASGYVPTNQDILRSRVMTIGITTTTFSYKGLEYVVRDVGGTRIERNKWIHPFREGVSTILFTIDVTVYRKPLFEDESINAMLEQLELFESLINPRWFPDTDFIIVLTRMDLLERCLRETEVKLCFPDFPAADTDTGYFEHYMKLLQKQFLNLCPHERRSRVRIVRGDITDTTHNPAAEVFEMLDHFSLRRNISRLVLKGS
ncbi:G-protein alpha subunit-domain-containing protein [Hypoxylon crocopeplum]|nr:G-protein alpha subunit-domain-containing protein [Hypoxylon crocopeplum]